MTYICSVKQTLINLKSNIMRNSKTTKAGFNNAQIIAGLIIFSAVIFALFTNNTYFLFN